MSHVYLKVSGTDQGASGARPLLEKVIDLNKAEWFATWAEEWKTETAGFSSIHRKMAHPAFMAIVGLGDMAIPLILRDLEAGPVAHWFPALKLLTDESPVPPEQRGNLEAMRLAWLQWGRERELI